MGYKGCSTTEKREKFDYRKHYLEHNKGVFGGNYICSQCGRIISKEEMQVDHIVPLKKWYAPNAVINCCAICPKCNKEKSDKVGLCTLKGIMAKVAEEVIVFTQNVFNLGGKLILTGVSTGLRLLVSPLTSKRSIIQKILIVCVYVYVVYLIISKFRG